jgi:hypothetical protein
VMSSRGVTSNWNCVLYSNPPVTVGQDTHTHTSTSTTTFSSTSFSTSTFLNDVIVVVFHTLSCVPCCQGMTLSLSAMLDRDNSCHLCCHPLASIVVFLSVVVTTANTTLFLPSVSYTDCCVESTGLDLTASVMALLPSINV